MTSNIGSELIKKQGAIGFISRSDEDKAAKLSYEKMKDKVLKEMKNTFRPEFLNRIDGVVVFHALSQEHIRKIVELMLSQVENQLKEKDIKLKVTDVAKDFLGEKGYDPDFGARPLRRIIERLVEDPLSDALLSGTFHQGKPIEIDFQENEDGKRIIVLKQDDKVVLKEVEPQQVAVASRSA
jgi:ATP-dependent Clp protease ATP-binding subunit ClpC